MKCAIMQPQYFPWPGYFNLIYKCDQFVFLDDAQYSKGSWHSKNFIITNKEKYLIKVPTIKSPLSTKINEKTIDEKKNWKVKQVKTIHQSYSNHLFINDLNELLDFFIKLKSNNLSELNIKLIEFISYKINIKCTFYFSSKFNLKEKRTSKLVQILELLNFKNYISPMGAKQYLLDDNFKKLSNVELIFNNFISINYQQKMQKNFISNLSIIDLIANLGWIGAENYVKDK